MANFSLICPHFVYDLATFLFCFSFFSLLKLDSNICNWNTVHVLSSFFSRIIIICQYMDLMDCKLFLLIFKGEMIILQFFMFCKNFQSHCIIVNHLWNVFVSLQEVCTCLSKIQILECMVCLQTAWCLPTAWWPQTTWWGWTTCNINNRWAWWICHNR